MISFLNKMLTVFRRWAFCFILCRGEWDSGKSREMSIVQKHKGGKW